MTAPRSYFGVVYAETGVLLGGLCAHESSKFETEGMAADWLSTVLDTNREAGRPCHGWTYASDRKPEIMAAEVSL